MEQVGEISECRPPARRQGPLTGPRGGMRDAEAPQRRPRLSSDQPPPPPHGRSATPHTASFHFRPLHPSQVQPAAGPRPVHHGPEHADVPVAALWLPARPAGPRCARWSAGANRSAAARRFCLPDGTAASRIAATLTSTAGLSPKRGGQPQLFLPSPPAQWTTPCHRHPAR